MRRGGELIGWVGVGRPLTSITVGVLAIIAVLAGGLHTLKKGWIALRSFNLNINLLMTVAVIGALLIGKWPEAAVVIWLFGLAEMIEAISLDRARNAIQGLMAMTPEVATVQGADGQWREMPAAQVAVVHAVLMPTADEIHWARRVLAADAAAAGRTYSDAFCGAAISAA